MDGTYSMKLNNTSTSVYPIAAAKPQTGKGNEFCGIYHANIQCEVTNGGRAIQLGGYSKEAEIKDCTINIVSKESNLACGIYKVNSDQLKIENTTINASANNGKCAGIYANSKTNGKQCTINNCNIQVDSNNNWAWGIGNYTDNMIINNTTVIADASDINDISSANGIENRATITFYSGNVRGTRNGLVTTSNSKTYVYGGYFESCCYGGINFNQGVNGEAKVQNATLAYKDYAGKYQPTANMQNSQRPSYVIGNGSESTTQIVNCTTSN